MVIDIFVYIVYVYEYGYYDIGLMKVFGFWIYLMSDCIIFVMLFVIYVVLVNGMVGGLMGKDIFELLFVLVEIVLLLFSFIIYGMVVIVMYKNNKSQVVFWLVLIWLFGVGFIGMEIYEFYYLIMEGFGLDCSGFLFVFFVLVGIYGLYVIFGFIWMVVLMFQVLCCGLISINCMCILCLSLFWYFLDVVWICVFLVVYLMGVM